MITWDNFYLFALPAIVLWGAGAVFACKHSIFRLDTHVP